MLSGALTLGRKEPTPRSEWVVLEVIISDEQNAGGKAAEEWKKSVPTKNTPGKSQSRTSTYPTARGARTPAGCQFRHQPEKQLFLLFRYPARGASLQRRKRPIRGHVHKIALKCADAESGIKSKMNSSINCKEYYQTNKSSHQPQVGEGTDDVFSLSLKH